MKNDELIKRELERKERYLAKMKELFYKQLEKQNIEMVNDGGYFYNLKYKDVMIYLLSNTDWNSWNTHYRVMINGKTLATRCNLDTAILKAKIFIERLNNNESN